MNLGEVIKFQIIQRTMGGGGGFNNQSTDQSVYESIQQICLQCVVFSAVAMIDECVKYTPEILRAIKNRYEKEMAYVAPILVKKEKLTDTAIMSDVRHDTSIVLMTRDHKPEHANIPGIKRSNELVDAILDLVSRMKNVPSMIMTENVQFLINFKDAPIQLTEEIFFQLKHVTWKERGSPETVEIALLSNKLPATDIIDFVRDTACTYRANLTNSLGNKLYFFNQVSQKRGTCYDPRGEPSSAKSSDLEQRRRAVQCAPSTLLFSKTPFYSSKTFDNICGPEARTVRARVEFFLGNKEWYNSKGIPYTLGILLSGLPGSGKTSILRAIANRTGRHIINVNFANIKTTEQMNTLFTSDVIGLTTEDGGLIQVNIPINKRLYVLEEIDALGGIVLDRRDSQATKATKAEEVEGELTLADILTTFDGTVETPERIVVITTNYPDRLDRALIRPGRIDVSIEFSYATPNTVLEMVELFMSRKTGLGCEGVPENLTCAEVSHVLLTEPHDASDQRILDDLQAMSEAKIEKDRVRENYWKEMLSAASEDEPDEPDDDDCRVVIGPRDSLPEPPRELQPMLFE